MPSTSTTQRRGDDDQTSSSTNHPPASSSSSSSPPPPPGNSHNSNNSSKLNAPSILLVTAGYDHTVRTWNVASGVCTTTYQHPESQVNKLATDEKKNYIAAAGNPNVKLYDVRSGNTNAIMSFEGHTGNVTCLNFEPAGNWFFTGSEDGSLKIWDVRAPVCQHTYSTKGKAAVNCAALHPNQVEILMGDQNGRVQVWDLAATSSPQTLAESAAEHQQQEQQAKRRGGSRTGAEGTLAGSAPPNLAAFQYNPEDDEPVRAVDVNCDGGRVAACTSSGRVFTWSPHANNTFGVAPTRRSVGKCEAHDSYVLRCLYSPDGTMLATTSADHTIKIWRGSDMHLLKTLAKHQRWVWDCSFSADSTYLVSASSDHSARLWRVDTGAMVRNFVGHQRAVVTVVLNDKGN